MSEEQKEYITVTTNLILADQPTPATGRYYPREELENAFDRLRQRTEQGSGVLFGEISSPTRYNVGDYKTGSTASTHERCGQIALDRIAAKIENIRYDEATGAYIAEVTPAGPFAQAAQDLINASGTLNMGMRAMVEFDPVDHQRASKIAQIITFDLVDPNPFPTEQLVR